MGRPHSSRGSRLRPRPLYLDESVGFAPRSGRVQVPTSPWRASVGQPYADSLRAYADSLRASTPNSCRGQRLREGMFSPLSDLLCQRPRPSSAPSKRSAAPQPSFLSVGGGKSPSSSPTASRRSPSGLGLSTSGRYPYSVYSAVNVARDAQRRLDMVARDNLDDEFSLRAALPAARLSEATGRPAEARPRSAGKRRSTGRPLTRDAAVQTDGSASGLIRGMATVEQAAGDFVYHQKWAAGAFAFLDRDKSGLLTRYELRGKSFLERMKQCMGAKSALLVDTEHAQTLIDFVMQKADKDGDGLLSEQEFIEFTWRLKQLDTDEGLEQQFVFAVFDSNKDGVLDTAELRQVFDYSSHGGGAVSSKAYIDKAMSQLDEDGDGTVTPKEYKRWSRSFSMNTEDDSPSSPKADQGDVVRRSSGLMASCITEISHEGDDGRSSNTS